jgi:hypothetical protein
MNDERDLSKTEACLGLTLIAGLLVTLVGVYVYRLDAPTPVTTPDPNWVTARPNLPSPAPVQQTAYRPQWLGSEGQQAEAYQR